MPRPKRTKIVRNHDPYQETAPPPTKDAPRTAAVKRVVTHFSSDSDGIVGRPRRGVQPILEQDGQLLAMSGGLRNRHDSPTSDDPVQIKSSLPVTDERPLPRAPPKARSKNVEEKAKASETTLSRARKSLSRGHSSVTERATPTSDPVPDSVVRNKDTNVVEKVTDSFSSLPAIKIQQSRPPSAVKIQGTPSLLSIANFKRRPRQHSILQMVRQSVANTARISPEADDFDSTVLTLGSSSPPQRSEHAQHSSSGSRKRRRLMLDGDDEQQNPLPSDSESLTSPINVDTPPRRTSATPQNLSSTRNHKSTPCQSLSNFDAVGDISTLFTNVTKPSRTIRSNPIRPNLDKRSRLVKPRPVSPIQNDSNAPSPVSSPMSNRDTPSPLKKARREKQNQATKTQDLTTAALRALLPKRRRNLHLNEPRHDDFDILDTNSERSLPLHDSDQDELQDLSPRRRTGTALKRRVRRATTMTSNGNAKQPRKPLTKKSLSRPKKQPPSKTYTRSLAASKENAPADQIFEDEAEAPLAAKSKGASKLLTKELVAAASKFREIDDWEMSFESADLGLAGASSSPWR